MWDVESGKLINSSPQMAVNNMVISPTGEYVATTDYLGYLWNVRENTTQTVSDDFDVAYFTGEGSFLLNRRNNYPYTIYEGEVAPVNTDFSKWAEIEKYVEYNGRLYGSNQQKGFWNIKANIETTGDTILILKSKLDEGETYIYVCQNKVCKLPTQDVDKAMSLMD